MPFPVLCETPEKPIVFFDFDSAAITEKGRQEMIDIVISNWKLAPKMTIQLRGHADRAGREDYNMRLSMRRAKAVRTALVQLGIPGNAISVSALGETDLAIPTADGVRELSNRRVEIIMTGP